MVFLVACPVMSDHYVQVEKGTDNTVIKEVFSRVMTKSRIEQVDRVPLTMNLTWRLAFSVCLHFGNTLWVFASCWLIGNPPRPAPHCLDPQESLRSHAACDAWAHLMIQRKPAAHCIHAVRWHLSFCAVKPPN